MSVITISPSNSNTAVISSTQENNTINVFPSGSQSLTLDIGNSLVSAIAYENIQQYSININDQLVNNVNLNNDIIIAPVSIPLLSFINCGRLSLVSNNPISSNNISSSIIYFTPYKGNEISIFDITSQKWKIYSFDETSLSLTGMTSNTNYDIFCYYNGSGLVLERLAWSSNSSRNISLAYINGVLVKSNEYNKKYLGTIRSTSTSTTEDSNTRRFVFNYYNPIYKVLSASDNITHTYSSSNIRLYRNISTLGLTRVEFINGIENHLLNIISQARFVIESNSSSVGVSLNSNTSFNTLANNINIFPFGGPSITMDHSSTDSIKPNIGYNYLQLVQSGSSVSTFYNASLKALFLC